MGVEAGQGETRSRRVLPMVRAQQELAESCGKGSNGGGGEQAAVGVWCLCIRV